MPGIEFHPELRRAARLLPKQCIAPFSLPLLRGAGRLMRRSDPKCPDAPAALTLPSGAGVRLHRPAVSAGLGPALLWMHGGGYVFGTAAQDDVLCRRFADELGATVAAVDYRLAPEHPHPAPLEDCYSALIWLSKLPTVDPARVAIGGASAGGGLAAALALLARDRGEIEPAAQLLVYPMLDDRSAHRSDLDNPGHRLWNRSSNEFGWRAYLGDSDPAVAVPGRRSDLGGLARAWIGVGTLDLFHNEDLTYAEQLRAADVPCEVMVIDGAFHGFDGIVPKAAVSQAFFASQCDLLRAAFEPTPGVDRPWIRTEDR